jgi:hypothetical protein
MAEDIKRQFEIAERCGSELEKKNSDGKAG